MKVAYAMPTWSGARLVESIHTVPSGAKLEIISTRQHGWALSKAWNYAAEQLLVNQGYDALILCNDDILLQPDTGDLLADALLNLQFGETFIGTKEWLAVGGYNTKHHEDRGPMWGENAIDFSCFAIGRKYWDTIGPFDENFNPCYFEDNDSHRRIRLAGYEAGCYAPYFHYGSTTRETDVERRNEIDGGKFEACKNYYTRKHGGIPGQEMFAHPFNDPARDWGRP